MSLEETIRETCSGLTAIRATERKKSANALKDFLTRNAVPSLLTNNTLRKTGYSWNHVFDNINDYIIKETEKFETSKSFDTVTAPLCTSLLHLCVAGSNKGHAYIKCQKVMDACFIIFDDSQRRDTIGDAYLSLLYKHILPVENYLGFISPAIWERLLDVAIYVCLSNRSLDDLIKIRLLWLVIKNAISYCQFSITLREYLAKLKKCCIRVLPDQKAQEFVVKIFTLLLESLCLECRFTMCEFSESILPSMLKLYEQSMDEKKKTLLFKLFQRAISIHHPKGRLQNTNGALAHNWDVWNKNLHSMLEIVCLEVNQVQKVRKQNENLSIKCNDFYHVSASAFYQIFNLPDKLQEDEPCNSAKKIKMFYNKNKSFNHLIEQLQLNAVVWVGIVQMYVKQFGHSITYGEYLSLISVLEKAISDNNKQMNWDRLEELTCLCIKNMITYSDYIESGNNEIVVSLLNTCVRNAAVTSTSQKTIHSILQVILNLIPLKYQNVQPLLVSYLEKGVPVNDYTLRTLNCLFNKFYRKTSYSDIREKCFEWLKRGDLTSIDVTQLNEFLLRLLSNDNLPIKSNCDTSIHKVYEIICDTTDISLLYSEFEYNKIHKTVNSSVILETFEINTVMYNMILAYIEENLTDYIVKLGGNKVKLIDYTKYLQIIIIFVDSLLKYKIKLINDVKEMPIYSKLRTALKYLFASLMQSLKSDIQIREKVLIMKSVQDIFLKEYNGILNTEVREHIEGDCFHCMNDIIKLDTNLEDNYEESDTEFNMFGLKQNCICTLAAYCRKNCCYRDEVLKCILDWDLYRHTTNFENVFNCIRLLNDSTVDNPPIELIFNLMQNMCKDLFRNPRATRSLLRTLSGMLEQIWRHNDDIIRKNCIIMVKSYLHRCSENFYPPDIACLVYECLVKIIMLNNKQDPDIHNTFKQILIEKIERSEYKIRLFCSHLLSIIANMFCDEDMQYLVDRLLNIFVINVAEKKETVLIDEKNNRTCTVLHIFYVLGTTKKSAIHKIILKVLKFQNEKSMDNNMVKKVLNMLTEVVTGVKIEVYMKNNILLILHYWFKESVDIKKMPIYLFGFDDMNRFIDEHMTWLIPADVLWSNNGIFDRSNVLKQVRDKTKKSIEAIIESCFCHIIALCLPHIVIEMYKLEGNKYFKVRETANANRMFQLTRQTLQNDRWSNLFVENLGEIMLLCATHVKDYDGATELFDVQLVDIADPYTYSRHVFSAILRYFGDLIDGNIMQYMCENQPLVILNILFKLWNNVLHEKVFEFKVLNLHTYMSFVQKIPLGYTSDAILCRFSCDSLVCAIKGSQNKELVRIYVKALKVIVTKVFNETQKSIIKMAIIPKTVSILTIKMEEGLVTECDSLVKYLKDNMNNSLIEDDGIDVVDFVNFITEDREQERNESSSKLEFEHKLKTYTLSLSNPSHDTLSKMARFLKQNNEFVKDLYADINGNGFSENCKTSLIHQVITFLNNILKTATDDKIIIAACNCLAEIGTYDIKTLVTVPPMETKNILDLSPKQYFALTVLTCLSEYFFDEDPIVSNKVIKALSMLLKFRDGQAILDFADVETEILKSLMSSECESFAEYKIDNAKFDGCNAIDYWIPISNESHSQWIVRITMALLDLLSSTKNFLTALQTVCASKPLICGKILPALMGLLLDCSTDIHVAVFGGQINEVFKYVWNLSFDDSFESIEIDGGSKISTKISQDQKMIVQYLLDVVDFIRIQRNHYKALKRGRTSDSLNYLNIDYLWVSWGAAVSESSLSALYYGELWAAANNGAVPPASPEATTALQNGEHVQKIFRRCFVSIGEMDALDGCGNAHLTSEREKRKHLINTGQFADALFLHDIALSRGEGALDGDILYGAITSLHKSGMHHLALRYIQSYPENEGLDDVKYDCLSYLGDWSEIVDTVALEEKSKKNNYKQDSIIKAMRYACLKDCLNLRTDFYINSKLERPINSAKLATARLCQYLNMENCQNVYRVISKLHLFRDIETYFSVRCGETSIPVILNEWRVDNLPRYNDFRYLEAIISQRSLMLEHISKNDFAYVPKVDYLQLQYAELGLSNQRIQMAQRLLATVKRDETINHVALLESQISWAKGHRDIALSLLNEIVIKESDDRKLSAMSLRQYGLWMAECKRESGRDIINKYLEKSLNMLNGSDDVGTKLKLYSDIAKFADAEYKQVVQYMNSSVFEQKIKCMENMEDTAASLGPSQNTLTRDEKKALMTSNAFRRLDKAEIDNTKIEKESVLRLAMRYYLLSLSQCDENNLSVFRVISLWVDNPGLDLENAESGPLGQLLHAIPSWKFITVLPQLAPRLTNENTPFARHLKQIIKTCAIEHPHHTLPILFNLKNSEKDQNLGNKGGTSQANCTEPRVLAATDLVQELIYENDKLALIIAQMEKICDATIRFAYYVPESKDARPQEIPRSQSLSHLRDLDAIPIPTDTIPIRKDCNYSNISTLSSFGKYYELVGGINFPKKISSIASDGKKRILLVKGEDDLRQDAVMQQVFNIVNSLLENNPLTYRNKLHIRTYKVVPMSRRSGVLEWCEGTMPLGAYLYTAHTKYRPQDITPAVARSKLRECLENKKPLKRKLEVFNGILKEFRPVFHYFFTEHYLDPVTWYERRLAYTRSVATSSMVGYIMGLGDRHVQNILIDKTTGEVIHIDFGIAFDQGKVLPTPETIPFRLTQDIVAGFGSSGVEGNFRRCCEKTLQLLRVNQETLLTILEVLLCDPLYLWIVSSTSKAKASNARSKLTLNETANTKSKEANVSKMSGGGEKGGGGLASRALLAVGCKLCGAEGGAAGGVSVCGQVARLIHEATDPANLCRLFHGWQPYL